ncbi:hypothetical protein CDG77_28810 [Nostoc sp. 'Peltigera membranacea cyanobiont' 213]|uniref:hypothetical protein n=1 Tax=Nostoc sp. 'Peltigera membranacea cyanobiont' 213 TaxID=2014530 RepID=UPI000B954C35|nr:hypothetical protein [Nostoc sp. 'Peltigera membranacea cyanobiont' 213]OYD87544.1 hypothetical protein CDG77_28810 [Nostoc sp. 'Peltigera membranacea cyanobiont' 213]
MKFSQLKITKAVLIAGVLGVTSLLCLINVEPSSAANYYNPSSPCKTSVPEPSPFIGVLVFGILGGGCLLKQRLRKKVDDLNNNTCSSMNAFYTSNNQQPRQIPLLLSDEQSEGNYQPLSSSLELQLIDPTEII